MSARSPMTIQNQTQADKLANQIADAILQGEFAPGYHLDEQQLAQRYGTSRTPVREALKQLTSTGLIEIRPRRGALVSQISPEQLESLFVAMAELEATCARLAAMSMTQFERRKLKTLHDAMADFASNGNCEAYTDANHAFHAMIYAGAHNSVLAEFTTLLRRRLAPYRRAQFRTKGRLPISHAEHDLVVKAILSGDASKAHASMLDHVVSVEDAFTVLEKEHATKSLETSAQ